MLSVLASISSLAVPAKSISLSSPNGYENHEKQLNDGELRRLCGLNVNETRRAFLQFDFESLLGKNECEWTLDSWCWAEILDKATLQQV
jgi:hypothetical protein